MSMHRDALAMCGAIASMLLVPFGLACLCGAAVVAAAP